MSTGEMSTEQFCLRWNDFHKTITSTFSDLRDDDEFLDVTLVSNFSLLWSPNLALKMYPIFSLVFANYIYWIK